MIKELQDLVRQIKSSLEAQTTLINEHKIALGYLKGLNDKMESSNEINRQILVELQALRKEREGESLLQEMRHLESLAGIESIQQRDAARARLAELKQAITNTQQ